MPERLFDKFTFDHDEALRLARNMLTHEHFTQSLTAYKDVQVTLMPNGFQMQGLAGSSQTVTVEALEIEKGQGFVVYTQPNPENGRILFRHRFEFYEDVLLHKYVSKKDGTQTLVGVYRK